MTTGIGQGKIRHPFVDENWIQRHLALDRVLFVPDLVRNLLSERYTTQNKVVFVSFDASKTPKIVTEQNILTLCTVYYANVYSPES